MRIVIDDVSTYDALLLFPVIAADWSGQQGDFAVTVGWLFWCWLVEFRWIDL